MSKRPQLSGDGDRPPKRPRPERPAVEVQEVQSARQLRDLLTFNQDGIQQLRHGIASVKAFLERILYRREEDERDRLIAILRDYLQTQTPADPSNFERPILSQLWQAWSFANENNIGPVASAISALLALLLKTISDILELREHGLLISRTLLQSQNLRLVKRGLEAHKDKEFLISPCLRLLTEVTCFDGGVLARDVYQRRELAFDVLTLRRNLNLAKSNVTDEEAQRRPAVRTHALRYALSLLKYLHDGGRTDMLKHRVLCSSLFQHLLDDPADVAIELFSTLEQSVLKQPDIPRSAKAALLTTQNLDKVRLVASRGAGHSASARALDWLKSVCSTPSYGILRPSGWYPPGTSKGDQGRDRNLIDLGLDSLDSYDREGQIQVRNPILLSWIQTMRPHTDPLQRDLFIMCLDAAPELVAAFFFDKDIQMDSKLTNTWIGYASLLFDIMRLPVPKFFGNEQEWAQVPPQTSIMLENILPRSLSAAVMSRCLKQGNDLITFFAIRALVLAFQKLSTVLQQLESRDESSLQPLWKEAACRLRTRFVARCPPMKDVTLCFRQMANDPEHMLQREAITRLLRLYYEVTPSQALLENFDISTALTTALLRDEAHVDNVRGEARGIAESELENLITIAGSSPGMKWFSTQGGLVFTPVLTLLRILKRNLNNRQIRALVNRILTESNVLQMQRPGAPFSPSDALISSVLHLTEDRGIWLFIDDCIIRATRKPVKYLDDIDALARRTKHSQPDTIPPSILAAVLLEQASFVISKDDPDRTTQLDWINGFLARLSLSSDNSETLDRLIQELKNLPGWRSRLPEAGIVTSLDSVKQDIESNGNTAQGKPPLDVHEDIPTASLGFSTPSAESDTHPELVKLNHKDIDLAIEDGDIDKIILCLCSQHDDVRKQAKIQLHKLRLHLRSSSGRENCDQLGLLFGELLETYEQHYETGSRPLPYLAGSFAVRALHVQLQPNHTVYPKLNKFLIRGPEWRVTRLPAYWLSNTLLNLPDADDAYWREAQWVLDWLVDGLRTPDDLTLLRKAGVFERVLAMWASPGAAGHKMVRERIFELIFRATCVEGGSNMLITRTGILGWLETVTGIDAGTAALLRKKIEETCSMERVRGWSGGAEL